MNTKEMTEAEIKIHKEALELLDTIYSQSREERQLAHNDRRFVSIAGAQWEGLSDQFENKPMFEVNIVSGAITNIVNQYTSNKIDVLFSSKKGEADELSDICSGLYRADEQLSNASEAHTRAFKDAVTGGMGAFRLMTCYENELDPESKKIIKIKPIYDPELSVFFNASALSLEKSEATECFVITPMTRKDYEKEWGVYTSSVEVPYTTTMFDWNKPDLVHVAEYYMTKIKTVKILKFSANNAEDISVDKSYIDENIEYELDLLTSGYELKETRTIKKKQVYKYILSGDRILESCGRVAGDMIPIIPVYGHYDVIAGLERFKGHVRLASDAQKIKNIFLSRLVEIGANSATDKPIFFPEQIDGHERAWANDSIDNPPYQLINPITDPMTGAIMPTGAIGFKTAPQIPPALGAIMGIANEDLQTVLGSNSAGTDPEMNSNMSGYAIELIHKRLDSQAHMYIQNMSKALRRSGDVWLAMAKEIYTEPGRTLLSINSAGKESSVTLGESKIDELTGKPVLTNDLTKVDFKVNVDVGLSSDSAKANLIRSLSNMMTLTQDQDTLNVLSSMIIMNLDGEGIDDVKDYFRFKLIEKGVVKPTPEEVAKLQQNAQNQKPSANDLYLEAAAKQAEADAAKSRASTLKIVADAEAVRINNEKTIAETLKLLSEIPPDAATINANQKMMQQIESDSVGNVMPT